MFKLEIIMSPDGRVGVNGPLDNKVLCLGLLELAKDIVIKYEHKMIQVASPDSIPTAEGPK